MTSDILTALRNFFVQIYNLGDSVELFKFANATVSLNQFLIAIVIMSIILLSLLTFARSYGSSAINSARNTGASLKYKNDMKKRKNNQSKGNYGSNNE